MSKGNDYDYREFTLIYWVSRTTQLLDTEGHLRIKIILS
jgi:hypothetical protein